jgi:hypothetical protein
MQVKFIKNFKLFLEKLLILFLIILLLNSCKELKEPVKNTDSEQAGLYNHCFSIIHNIKVCEQITNFILFLQEAKDL